MAASGRRHRGDDPRVLLLLALFTTCSSSAALAQAQRPFEVLAMHMVGPDSESAKANIVWTSTVRDVLQSRLHRPVDVFQEFLPVDRLATPDASRALRDYLHERYRDQHIDVVISGTSAVLDFLLRFRDDLFPTTPIVSAGLRIPDSVRDMGAGVAVVEATGNFRETLALALRLHPATRQVYVLIGRPALVPQFRLELEPIAGNVELTYIADRSVPEMIQAVKHAPADSLIFYLGYTQDVPGRQLSRLEVAQLVAEASPVPVYGLYEADIGLGIVGGVVRRVEDEAVQLATLAARVLNGERAQDIPIQSVQLVPMFDWRQLQRWTIRESTLPAGSDVRFRVPTVWEQYRWLIVGTVAVLRSEERRVG